MSGGEAESGGKDATIAPPLVLLGFAGPTGLEGSMTAGVSGWVKQTP